MTSADLKPGYEHVHTVTEYYDGPRKGIADYRGEPNLYECIFDELKDDYSESFRLAPLDAETFRMAMEDWVIWFIPLRTNRSQSAHHLSTLCKQSVLCYI